MEDTKELRDLVQQHERRLGENRVQLTAIKEIVDRHDDHIVKLSDAMSDLKARFGTVATKDDVKELSNQMNKTFQTNLGDALKAVPQNAVMLFTGVLALIAIVDLVIHFLK